ncbi:1-aminocyclopropane-1-carboxylate deaminase/D-cysteine desulfhydrase [Streptomyces sp. NPDC056987]|uniref:1-aminocyclopropane-1-carboxylate deaminase/D-cysteine desulfhydrase n=1 Tax=Streptomyces sp. NPDC056987 TaxID=3345988 RepID=UPI00362F5A1F
MTPPPEAPVPPGPLVPPVPPSPLVSLAALRPRLPSPLHEVEDERFARRGVRLLLKRDDLIHPELPGNKWRKLAPNLRAAADAGRHTLLTFGGAYSNHLRATAAAGRLLGFATVGVVRGEELADRPRNPSLARCAADGMRLLFVDRAEYRRKAEPAAVAALLARAGLDPGQVYVVPEGGSNALAAQGCAELGRELRGAAGTVAVACGTGGTLAGLAAGLAPDPTAGPGPGTPGEGRTALGFPVLRGGFLGGEIRGLQRAAFAGPAGDWRLDDRFHFGGFARVPPELDAFARDFEDRHGLAVERLYVAKMLYGVTTLAAEGAFPPGTAVAAVITGAPEPSTTAPSTP